MPLFLLISLVLVGCGVDYSLGDDKDLVAPPQNLKGVDYADSFELSRIDEADIIIYADTSQSMEPELLTMGNNILQLTDQLKSQAANWHLMAVTGPSGCGVDGWFTETTTDFDTLFANAIITKPVPDDEDEMGLQNVEQAVANSFDGGCNDGFLREDSMLHIIFISDENDESPGFETTDYWRSYVDNIIDLRGNASLVKFSAVAGPQPGGCEGAEPGDGYAEVVEQTAGEYVSICDNWPQQLGTLADASIYVEIFPLTEVPIPSTIEVVINDLPIEGTWLYEPNANQIRFVSDPPRSGDIIDINYITAGPID